MFTHAGHQVFWLWSWNYTTIHSWDTISKEWLSQEANSDCWYMQTCICAQNTSLSNFQFCCEDIVKGSWVVREKGKENCIPTGEMYKTPIIKAQTVAWKSLLLGELPGRCLHTWVFPADGNRVPLLTTRVRAITERHVCSSLQSMNTVLVTSVGQSLKYGYECGPKSSLLVLLFIPVFCV